MTNYFNITGMGRSGTTLIQNIINYPGSIYAGKQPFPKLFINTKKDFYQSISHPEKNFVYNDYCIEQRYQFSDFRTYLQVTKFSNNFVNEAIEKGYSGQWEDISEIDVTGISYCNFSSMYKKLLHSINHKKIGLQYLGAKHNLNDEFIPYFLKNNIKTISIYRKLMNMIKTSEFGVAINYVGEILPTLYVLINLRRL